MTAALPGGCVPSDPDAVREQLARILRSGPFKQSQRRQRFLRYLVDETLAGRGDRLKAYTIAVAVFDRPSTFDPVVDPVVRIEAGRLRDKLREYYDTHGRTDPVRIELPKGSYAPHIETRLNAVSAHGPDAAPRERLLGDAVAREPALRRFAPFTTGWPLAGLLAGAALLIAVASVWGSRRPPLPDNPSIAVLPFDNIGHDARWQRFADGITEDTITDLTHAKDLMVIARNSTEVYRDKPIDVRKIGRDLHVKYVLEGSIQPIGERIRVTAQLIDSASGSHVWSERYDRPAGDLFALQSEVTQRIAATLMGYQGAVAEAERRFVRRKPPASLTAYDTYLLGIEAKHRVTKESLAEAESLLNKAIGLDPQLARAYVALAEVQFYLIDLGLAPSFEGAVEKMMDAAEKAVALDPDDGKTHLALGMAYLYSGKQEQAATELARAEALASSDADVLICVAWSLPPLGQSERAVALVERSLQLNPHYPYWYNQGLSYVYFFGGQYNKAAEYRRLVKKPLALDHAFAAVTYAYLDRPSDAEAAAASVLKLDPAWNAERYLSEGGGFADREAELFVDGARKAGLPSCMPPALLKDVPHFIRVKSCDRQRASTSG